MADEEEKQPQKGKIILAGMNEQKQILDSKKKLLTFGGPVDQQMLQTEDEEVASIIKRVSSQNYFTLFEKAESSKEEVDAFIKNFKKLEKFLLSQLKMEHIIINGNASTANHSYSQQQIKAFKQSHHF